MEGNEVEVFRSRITEIGITHEYRVQSSDEALTANAQLGKIKSIGKEIEAAKDAVVRPLNEAVKAAREKFKPAEALLAQAEVVLKGALITFRNEEQKRIDEQNRQRAIAAAAEKAKLEEGARKLRYEAEAKAVKAEEAGNLERAEAIREQGEVRARANESVAQMIAAPSPPPETTKLAGLSVTEVWEGKVTDLPLFLKSLAASPYDIEDVIEVKPAGLNRLAKSLKGRLHAVLPGAVAWAIERASARAR